MTRLSHLMGGLVVAYVGDVNWLRIEDHEPPQKTLLMVTGDSGYAHHKKFLTLARVDDEYRPRLASDGPLRWINVQDSALSDQGWYPTHWAEMIPLPGTEE